MKKNLVLTGMMGVGKSTVAKKLSKKLGLKFVDIDKIIEKKEQATIKDIFNDKGEEYFRKIEKMVTLDVLQKKNLVIALGGGAFMSKTIRKEVNNLSISFWLDLNIKSILPRIKNIKKRPLLKQNNLEETMNKIYLERKKFYNESHFRIKCTSMDLEKIVNKIVKLYQDAENKI